MRGRRRRAPGRVGRPLAEAELVGKGGSGLVLMAACNLNCKGSSSFSFSRELRGVRRVSAAELAGIVLELSIGAAPRTSTSSRPRTSSRSSSRRCVARREGVSQAGDLELQRVRIAEALALLEGIVDVYLPNLKHGSNEEGRLAGVMDYFDVARACITEMHRQTGDLQLDDRGIAIVRRACATTSCCGWRDEARGGVSRRSRETEVNLMPQSRPVTSSRRTRDSGGG